MATVVPFRGLRYARPWIPSLPRLVTPPYDIISPALQQKFYRSHPCNIIRLELGRTQAGDSPANNPYTRARETLQAWLRSRVLAVEPRPAFYVIRTDFTDPDGGQRHFTGLLGRVKLEPLGTKNILPHERTFAGPKLDRLHLLQATGVGFSPVFSLYQDPERQLGGLIGRLTRRRPQADFHDWSGSRQRLWVVTPASETAAITRAFRRRKLLIADGHHRYSTALTYCDRHRAQAGPAAEYVMMCLAETHDPGLTVLPVCRLVRGVAESQWRKFRAAASRWFEIEPVASLARLRARQAQAQAGRVVLGGLGPFAKGWCLLALRPDAFPSLQGRRLADLPPLLQQLDVVALDRLILQGLLNIPAGDEAGRVTYTKNPKEARLAVEQGKAQAAFFPGPPCVDHIWRVAQNGLTMPQKSTYFLPKLITGLVMNPVSLEPVTA